MFVYNARRGLPPDIPATLETQRESTRITIDHLSSDKLWEMARADASAAVRGIRGAERVRALFFARGRTRRDRAGGRGRAGSCWCRT